jgi:adenylate kinase family enzyme
MTREVPQEPPLMRLPAAPVPARVVVIGTTGSGKTSLARRIAAVIDARHVELDALFHGPGWTPAPDDVFRARIEDAMAAPRWVLDGSYRRLTADLVWPRAGVILWLDYPFPRVMWRLLRRTLVRGLRRQELWNGNRESLRAQFLTNDSLFVWARKSHWRHRTEYPEHFRAQGVQDRVVRLRSPAQAERWLADLRSRART